MIYNAIENQRGLDAETNREDRNKNDGFHHELWKDCIARKYCNQVDRVDGERHKNGFPEPSLACIGLPIHIETASVRKNRSDKTLKDLSWKRKSQEKVHERHN